MVAEKIYCRVFAPPECSTWDSRKDVVFAAANASINIKNACACVFSLDVDGVFKIQIFVSGL